MKTAILATAILATASIADANPCAPSYHVGNAPPFCPRLGQEYVPPMFDISVGIITADLGITTAVGGQYRFLGGFFHGIYTGGELTLYWLDEPDRPRYAHRSTTTEDVTLYSRGRGEEIRAMAGMRRTVGPVLLGAELAGGVRWLRMDDVPQGAIVQGVVDARVTGGVWLSPYLSVAINAGIGLVRPDEYTTALMIGIHPFPWDGLR